MTLADALALFLIMGFLAAIPSSSVLLVVTQSTAFGLRNGVASAAGVVAGDLLLMAIAILGMTTLAQQMGAFFVIVKYLAAGYLIWFGIGLIRSYRRGANTGRPAVSFQRLKGLPVSFASGLLLTLGDIKAIFFYASLLPAFVNLAELSTWDVLIVSGITIATVGGVKVAYAYGAGRAMRLARGFTYERELKAVSGGVLFGAGVYILLRD
ncbi:MAG: LysE family translocator [Pseudomonadota bacterium]